jgi:hypothetical protein
MGCGILKINFKTINKNYKLKNTYYIERLNVYCTEKKIP